MVGHEKIQLNRDFSILVIWRKVIESVNYYGVLKMWITLKGKSDFIQIILYYTAPTDQKYINQ